MALAEVIAASALERVEAGAPADRVLKRTLRAHPELDNDGRRRVAELVHGVRCHRVRLEYLAARFPELSWHELYDRRDDLLPPPSPSSGPVARGDWPAGVVERLRVWGSLPDFVAADWYQQFGDSAFAVAEVMNTPGPIAIRARGDRDTLALRLRAEGMDVAPRQLAPCALRLSGRPDIRGSAAWRDGAFEVQDEASQMVAVAVDARPGEAVIDLCAGAGGKTLALAAAMEDTGTLWACDVDGARLRDLEVRLGRVDSPSVRVVDLTGSAPSSGADRVLVDAPCSATGTWRRGPDRKWRVSAAEVASLASLQLDLLRRAFSLVRPGGRIVYATCSLLSAENAEVASAFEASADVEAVPVWPGASPRETLRPDEHDTDGFFVAAFVRLLPSAG
jgi:16S rRNA (cytosine967-C5)-methyltransferase